MVFYQEVLTSGRWLSLSEEKGLPGSKNASSVWGCGHFSYCHCHHLCVCVRVSTLQKPLLIFCYVYFTKLRYNE